jgi:hypothetical protein
MVAARRQRRDRARRSGRRRRHRRRQRFEREGDVARVLKPLCRVFLEAVVDDAQEACGHRRRDLRDDFRRIVAQNREHRFRRRRATECPLSRHHFVEHDAKREQIRSMVARFTAHLFWRHVPRRAQHRPRIGLALERRRLGRVGIRRRGHLTRETEVEDLHAAVAGDEDVRRLQIAMDDAAVVRGGESAGDLDAVIDRLADPNARGWLMADG